MAQESPKPIGSREWFDTVEGLFKLTHAHNLTPAEAYEKYLILVNESRSLYGRKLPTQR